MDERSEQPLGPVFGIGTGGAYAVPRAGAPTDLRLDGNEGRAPELDWDAILGAERGEFVCRYPNAGALEARLARELSVDPTQVILCAGADDATLRLCTALLGPEREIVLPVPTFEMIARYAALRGCAIREVPWPSGPYPVERVLAEVNERTSLVTVVSPNNPTGAVARAEDLGRLSEAAPHAWLLVDLAYVEFGGDDLTAAALALPNAVVLRTLSKAQGLAGLRVGYAVGPARLIDWLRQAGNPYPVSSLSLRVAEAVLDGSRERLEAFVAQVGRERPRLVECVTRLGGEALPSEANFVLCRFPDALWVRDGLAGHGIAVRAFPGRAHLEDALRITCPGDEAEFTRLTAALESARAPGALLFDMDGVLADVSGSFRSAIVETARSFGVELTAGAISAAKHAGNANDDWSLTHRLVTERGVETSLEEVTARFEALYQGTDEAPGLRASETLLVARETLAAWAQRLPLGIVTGRPRADAERFLEEQGIADLFGVLVAREDAPLKPDPRPLQLALERCAVERAWYVGDTVDDIGAARAAGVLPLGVLAPGEEPEAGRAALTAAGAARVLDRLAQLEEILP